MRAHVLFVVVLVALGLLIPLAIGLRGCDYYTTPEAERPFHPHYEELKPSGVESHGYGIVGSLMIMSGVGMYASRKRLSFLRNAGPIRTYLSVHIFLCLLGPSLIIYHTTFKFGGLVAVSVWSMLAVVASGVIGRYLYIQIPKTMQGQEMTEGEMTRESEALRQTLLETSGLSQADLDRMEATVHSRESKRHTGMLGVLLDGLTFDLHRRRQLRIFRQELERSRISGQLLARLSHLALRRSVLRRRVEMLEQSRRIFHLWHVIHLPFTIVMFVILFLHVGVAVAFGYWWIW
ncbi:MAG: hypothetical protein IPI01_07840 [Ignavibacteriae bacterium]|nr:hypothetical protein [Ignavibacteriota bacterium]